MKDRCYGPSGGLGPGALGPCPTLSSALPIGKQFAICMFRAVSHVVHKLNNVEMGTGLRPKWEGENDYITLH